MPPRAWQALAEERFLDLPSSRRRCMQGLRFWHALQDQQRSLTPQVSPLVR
jgi:hypothetical protein